MQPPYNSISLENHLKFIGTVVTNNIIPILNKKIFESLMNCKISHVYLQFVCLPANLPQNHIVLGVPLLKLHQTIDYSAQFTKQLFYCAMVIPLFLFLSLSSQPI